MSSLDNNDSENPEHTDRLKLFSALGSETRLRMLQRLTEGEMHISELARELSISVPVAAKHANILEDADLIQRKVYGKTHVLQLNNKNIFHALDIFAPSRTVEVKKGATLLEALKKAAVVEVKDVHGQDNIVSTNGEEGFFVYEVDGVFSDKNVNEYLFDKDSTVMWKKLEPISILKVKVKIAEE
ncbi:helix-turn-helix domain-containing protein [Methanolobus bombayensis]|uniref:helix-turn-helix domain-containing protein n=1 Tax=Methanolobus bombayensis TaxID=38023 RepID=UPI001AE15ECC|nr:helix-turn-helix domain-containing protein [Methanolobus bombayensis]MBP1910544.1 DNA-binding transcriptional ArsR family regulator [Methanolobus bombayensis]